MTFLFHSNCFTLTLSTITLIYRIKTVSTSPIQIGHFRIAFLAFHVNKTTFHVKGFKCTQPRSDREAQDQTIRKWLIGLTLFYWTSDLRSQSLDGLILSRKLKKKTHTHTHTQCQYNILREKIVTTEAKEGKKCSRKNKLK